MGRRALLAVVCAMGLGMAGPGCREEGMTVPTVDPVPDFTLTDLNSTSPRAGETVSPRDYEGQVSAWYFGHAT